MFSLSNDERLMYCDPDFYKLIKVVMIADSESYTFLGNVKNIENWRDEFKRANDKMLAKWTEFWQTR
jgi:hypothetical protein